jgi:hypothetical protein
MVVLADLGKAAQESILSAQEKAIFAQRIANAGTAVLAWSDFLTALDKQQAGLRQGALLPHRERPVRTEVRLRHPVRQHRRADLPQGPGRARGAA